jgi:hypothetical protein
MDLEQLEALALGKDRSQALSLLVPGTEDHDFWRAVTLQREGRLDEVDVILQGWRSRHGDTEPRSRLERRQLLLRADRDLAGQAPHLAALSGVSLEHPREVEADGDPRWPVALDPQKITRQAVLEEALRRDRGLGAVTDAGLPYLLGQALDNGRRRQLLARLQRSGLPGLVDAIAQELSEKASKGFGSLAAHQALTSAELQELAARVPQLRAEPAWVYAVLQRMRPPSWLDLEGDLAARSAWLLSLWQVVEGLPPSFGALKVHLGYHLLETDLRMGRFDRDRLLAYLALPRRAGYVRHAWIQGLDSSLVAGLHEDYQAVTGLPAVGQDEALVRAHLSRHLAREGTEAFGKYLDPRWLERLLAEVRLLAGDRNTERWTTLLGAEGVVALRQRVDLELLPTNRRLFGRSEPVALEVALKNTDVLRVRVFRIDVAAYFRTYGTDVDARIDLDGLAPRAEETRAPAASAMLRQLERIEVPGCAEPGTYVVELVGNGRASRALVRKGDLRCITRPSPAGLAVRVLDEQGQARPEAWISMGGRSYLPRADGTITLPFTTRPGWVPALLCDSEIAVPTQLQLPVEQYELRLDVDLDRQALVPGSEAKALLRLQLLVGGLPTTLSLVEEPFVEIQVIDRVGVAARRRHTLELSDEEDVLLSFPVPEHPAAVSVAVGGRVRVVSEQRQNELRAEWASEVGTLHRTDATEAPYLRQSSARTALHLLGHSGEPRPGRTLRVELGHRLVQFPIEVTLATNEQGVVDLGALPDITSVRAFSPSGVEQRFELQPPAPLVAHKLISREGEELVVPVPAEAALPAEAWQLVELRAGQPAVDRRASVTVQPGLLRLRGLPPGDHRLTVRERTFWLQIVPASAPVAAGWAVLPAAEVEVGMRPTVLGAVSVRPDGLHIEVLNPTPRTRVHLIGTALWYCPVWPHASFATRQPGDRGHVARTSVYLSGRDIGDEARYVMDRRQHPRRPGSMLERPSVLLNPWALRTTETSVQTASSGAGWGGAPAAAAPTGAFGGRARGGGGRVSESEPALVAYEFLAGPAVVLADLALEPGEDGHAQIRVPAASLEQLQLVRLVCVDPSAITQRLVPLPERALAVRDRRLAAALPADRHWRESRRLVPLLPEGSLAVADRATSRIETVDTVEKLWRALCALGGHPDLAAWDFLPRWGSLSREEKLALYSKHACHELALFVYFKDRPLFDEALRPYLANKLHPTLIDLFLLGGDVSAFLEPWRFAKLNALEKALLARIASSVPAHLRDLTDLEPPDPERDDRLVDTFLAGSRLSDDGPGPATEAPPPPPPAPIELAEEEAEERMAEKTRSAGPARKRAMAYQRMSKRDEAEVMNADGESDDLMLDLDARDETKVLYRAADKTREWAEHNWWHTRVEEAGPWLVPARRLWWALAEHRGDGPFLSEHVGDAAESFTASVCALAVLALPFRAERAGLVAQGQGLVVRSAAPMLVALAELSPMEGEPTGEVLVGESWFRADDRWEWEGAEQREKYVSGELVIHVVYTLSVVITNPTSRLQRLAVLVQIPAGAIAVSDGIATRTHRVELAPYQTTSLEVSFYFPAPGAFEHYGTRVTRDDTLVAAAEGRRFTVVRVPTTVDPDSWAHVSQHGSLEEVLRWLGRHNLGRVELERIAWRLADREAFARITDALDRRHVYSDVVWGYGLLHHDRRRVAQWLAHQGWVEELAPFRTQLVAVEPVERGRYQHLEYAPLINARAHQLGGRRTVLNDGLLAQWRAFLERVALSPPEALDWLEACHYLFSMDRPEEAALALQRAAGARTGLQLDLLTAYAAVVSQDLDVARARVEPHLAHPVDRWRHRFQELAALIDEVQGREVAVPGGVADSRDATLAQHAAEQPTLRVSVEAGQVVIEHRQLQTATLRFHLMDVELLFSREPFLGAAGDRFALVDPGATQQVTLEASGRTAGRTHVPLPAQLARKNVVIEAVAGALRHTTTHLAHDLAVSVIAPYGQLRVARASTNQALPATYVKTYARMQGGGVSFYKDGYTDLRGRLDYATLSTDDLDRVERFALLVMHDEAGAQVLEVEPPTR